MSHHTCPQCRQAVSDDALDAGDCPFCGYDGPMAPTASAKAAWLLVTLAVLIGGLALGGYLLYPRATKLPPVTDVAGVTPQSAPAPVVAPPPPTKPAEPDFTPLPQPLEPIVKKDIPAPEPAPVVLEPPKKNPWNPVPAKAPRPVVLDPREAPDRKLTMRIDNPHGTVTIPDLNGKEQVTLTGRTKVLKLGSINDEAVIDASGLVAEEIVISGDINENTVAKLNAPGGKVTIGGHVVGSARLIAIAPGGEVEVSSRSGRFGGSAKATLSARRVVFNGPVNESARVAITLSSGGFLKVALMDGAASVTYKKSAAADPEPTIETGELRNGTKVSREQ